MKWKVLSCIKLMWIIVANEKDRPNIILSTNVFYSNSVSIEAIVPQLISKRVFFEPIMALLTLLGGGMIIG